MTGLVSASSSGIALLHRNTTTTNGDPNMNHAHSHLLIKHGVAAMIVALLGGFMLTFSMLGGISFSPLPIFIEYELPGTPQGWRAVHLGMLMNGMMAILLGAAIRWLVVTPRGGAIVAWGTIIAVWGNFCFYLFSMFGHNHGLTLGDNRLGPGNWAGAMAFIPAIVGAVTLLAALIVMLRARPAA